MSSPALSETVEVRGRRLRVEISPIRRYDDYGPDYEVVHAWALREDGIPLALHDLRPDVPEHLAYTLWSFLCDQISAAAILAYGLRPPSDGRANPRLGCWGPRLDLRAAAGEDSATALVMGIAVDTTQATRPGREALFVLAVRAAIVASLRRWADAVDAVRHQA